MRTKKPVDLRAEAKAYVDTAIETMRRHGAEPKLSEETYRQTVEEVSRSIDSVWRLSSSGDMAAQD